MNIGNDQPFFLIAGPCQIESEQHAFKMAREIKHIAEYCGIDFFYKSSFDKANRTSLTGKRGAGLARGMEIFDKLKAEMPDLKIITDIHTEQQAALVAPHVDALQIPAFLCRQTDLLLAAGETGKYINIKKGQFLAPWDMGNAVQKCRDTGNEQVLVTERGTSFGYGRLVVDMAGLADLAQAGAPVPAHRVVNRLGMLSGRLHFPTPTAMAERLTAEGVEVRDDRVVDFDARFWDPSTEL